MRETDQQVRTGAFAARSVSPETTISSIRARTAAPLFACIAFNEVIDYTPTDVLLARLIRFMATITIRNLEDNLKRTLRVRAASHGRSMEEEVRQILREALSPETEVEANLAERLRRRFQPLGGVELPELTREPLREPPQFLDDDS